MGSSILSVGQSALAAAQAGLVTTGHNIANASTPGYSRQEVIQGSAGGQDTGFGFLGKGTQVVDVRRVYDDVLADQVRTAQTSQNRLETYSTQVSQINNLLADANAGLSPALKDFFAGMQSVASNPNSTPARQTALSSAETLAGRFQSLDAQLQSYASAVNTQINSSVTTINSYAQQIASLNDAIEKAMSSSDGKASNDLLDQRDQAVTELSKEVRTSVVKQGNSYNVFIGSGQPLAVGAKPYNLIQVTSPTDQSRAEIGYVSSSGQTMLLAESSLTGGKLGGLFDFRSQVLDTAQNSLGRVAIGLAATFNAQHQLGQDQNGALGTNFFNAGSPRVNPSSSNNQTPPIAAVSAAITDASMLTTSDYRLQYTGGNYVVTRLSDNKQLYSNAAFPSGANVIEGVTLTNTGTFSAGDEFLIRPTATGATGFSVAITDPAKIAAAAPIRTSAPTSNAGTGTISAGTVNTPPPPNANLTKPVTIKFTSATTFDVIDNTTSTSMATNVTYTAGGNISYNGWTVQISGSPVTGDTFAVGPNTGGTSDNRNAVILAAQQTTNTLGASTPGNPTTSFQGAYGQLVSMVGNQAHEMEVTSKAGQTFLDQAVAAQQSLSGVNLDEEATNLMRYQQAYQAAARVMQTANQLFQLLLNLGGTTTG